MRTTRIQPEALEHLSEWAAFEPKILKRIFRIIEECCRTPFEGIGKPEQLKGDRSDSGHVALPTSIGLFMQLLIPI